MSETNEPCPCGGGLYTVHSEMDDWNRHREHWEMKCPKCKAVYILQSEGAIDSGISYERYFWARKENVAQHDTLMKKASVLVNEADLKARERHFDTWKALFKEKNKKYIWSIITNNGEHYPSLGTFYKHVKHEGLEQYLDWVFKNENDRALILLGVKDDELIHIRAQAEKIKIKAMRLLKET